AKKKAKASTDDEAYALDDDGGDGGDDGGSDGDRDNTGTGTGKWRPKQVSPDELQQLIAIRTSPAVKAALEALASAPTSGGAKKKTKKLKK
ncbi:MAG: hypothetical protein ACRC6G_09335, partial [Deefgea sp.]